MKFWGGGEPALTVSARKLSGHIGALDADGRRRAVHTVRSLIDGIRGLGSLPSAISSEMWSILVTVARKAITGADETKLFEEIRAGLSPELIEIIETEARR